MAHFNNNGNNNTTTAVCYWEKGWGGPERAVTLLECGWQYGGCVSLLFLGILTLLCVSCVLWCGCSRLFLCILSCREWEIYLWIIWFCLTSFLPEVILLSFIQTLSYFFFLLCLVMLLFPSLNVISKFLSFSLSKSLEWRKSHPYCLLPFYSCARISSVTIYPEGK